MYIRETGKYEGYIYLIRNKVNGKIYIGQTSCTIRQRFNGHVANSRRADCVSIIDRAIAKYGKDNFDVTVLHTCEADSKRELKQMLNDLEIKYISQFDSTNHLNGYNISPGGGQASQSAKVPVDQYDLFGKFIRTFNSMTEASESVIGDASLVCNIQKCCEGRYNHYRGYRWVYAGAPQPKVIGQKRPIDEYDMLGHYIKTYPNSLQISDELSVRQHITNCCSGVKKDVNGKIYRWYGEPFDAHDTSPKKEIIRPVLQYDKSGVFIRRYDSEISAQTAVGVSAACIANACKGKQNYAGGCLWCFDGDDITIPNNKTQGKPVKQFTVAGEYITTFANAMLAARSLGFESRCAANNIRMCCNKRKKTAYGYVWSFDDVDANVKSCKFGVKRPVKLISNNDDIQIVFQTIAECATYLNISQQYVGQLLRSGKNYHGYNLCYVLDDNK